MPTRNIVLSAHQHDLVESLVSSGRYQNASEVLRDGLRLIEQRERLESARLQALKDAAEKGWADIANSRYLDLADDQLDDFIARLGQTAASHAAPHG